MNLGQAIVQRVSTRSFTGGELLPADISELRALAAGHSGNAGVRMAVLEGINGRVGTYGVVSRSTAAMVLITDGSRRALFEAGRLGELAVLRLTAMGYGTCWLGATFDSGQAARKAALAPGEQIVAIIVAGCVASKPTLRDRLFRAVVHSRSRKPFDELFTIENGAEGWIPALEAVRLAPSARNLQPWRAVARKGRVDFYMVDTGRFALLDMGIARTHFEIAAGIALDFFKAGDTAALAGASYLYSASPKAGSSVVM